MSNRLADRPGRRLPKIGVVRLGVQVPVYGDNGQQRRTSDGKPMTRPAQTDFFVLTDAPKLAAYYEQLGIEKVREMRVRLPYSSPYRNFTAGYGVWAGGIRVCKGDGHHIAFSHPFTVIQKKKGGVSVRNAQGQDEVDNGRAKVAFAWGEHKFVPGDVVPCPGRAKDLYPHCEACRMSAVLRFMPAEPEVFEVGYYQLTTQSMRNYETVLGVLEMLPENAINKIPFVLRLVEEPVQFWDKAKKLRTGKKWFVHLVPDPQLMRQLLLQQQAQLFSGPQPVAMLAEYPAPRHEPERFADESAQAVEGEWIEDPPSAPPFAENGGPAETEPEVARSADESAQEGDVAEAEPRDLPPCPPSPRNLTKYTIFSEAAVKRMGFTDVDAVTKAVKAVNPDGTLKPRDLWAELWVYKHAQMSLPGMG